MKLHVLINFIKKMILFSYLLEVWHVIVDQDVYTESQGQHSNNLTNTTRIFLKTCRLIYRRLTHIKTLVRKRRNLIKILHHPKPPSSPLAPITTHSLSISPSLSTRAAAEVALSPDNYNIMCFHNNAMTSCVNIWLEGGGACKGECRWDR